MVTGRPRIEFSQDVADKLCRLLAEGNSLRTVMAMDGMPSNTVVYRWLREEESFSEQYAQACADRADSIFDEMMAIADTPVVGEKRKIMPDGTVEVQEADMLEHRKLQIDVRKWSLARMAPKKYGDKVEHSGSFSVTLPEYTDKL